MAEYINWESIEDATYGMGNAETLDCINQSNETVHFLDHCANDEDAPAYVTKKEIKSSWPNQSTMHDFPLCSHGGLIGSPEASFECSFKDLEYLMSGENVGNRIEWTFNHCKICECPWQLTFFLNYCFSNKVKRFRNRVSALFSSTRFLLPNLSDHTAKLIVANAILLEMHTQNLDWIPLAVAKYDITAWHEFIDLMYKVKDCKSSNIISLLLPFGTYQPYTCYGFHTIKIYTQRELVMRLKYLEFNSEEQKDLIEFKEWSCGQESDIWYSALLLKFELAESWHSIANSCEKDVVDLKTVEFLEINLDFICFFSVCVAFHIEWAMVEQKQSKKKSELIFDCVSLKIKVGEDLHCVKANLPDIQICRNWFAISLDPKMSPLKALSFSSCPKQSPPLLVNLGRSKETRLIFERKDGKAVIEPKSIQIYWRQINIETHVNGFVGLRFC